MPNISQSFDSEIKHSSRCAMARGSPTELADYEELRGKDTISW